MMLMRFFFLIFFMKAYVVGNHLNCLDKSGQFKHYENMPIQIY